MKIVAQNLNIIDFIRHPLTLNDQTMSMSQNTFLKSCYGLALDEAELAIFRSATGRKVYVPREQREVTLLGGRRGGKTGKLACRIALYEACRIPRTSRGERSYVMLIGPTLDQAQIAYNYILQDLRNSKTLAKNIAKVRGNEIELKNRVVISCCACSPIKVRGRAAIAVICDEICFWSDDVTSASCDEEVLAAVRPAMATYSHSKIIKISTPNTKSGVVWHEFNRRAELDHPVWQLSSQELNPTISTEFLEAERSRSLKEYEREYLAEFVDSVVSWIEPEVLARCVIQGRKQLPRVSDGTYAAAIDPAFRHSDFALAIAHRTSAGFIVIDRVAFWTGSKRAPLGFEWVCNEVAQIIEHYEINTLIGDQYAAPAIQQEFQKLGISYRELTFNRRTRATMFGNLMHVIQQQRIELPDDPTLLKELRSLEEVRGQDGNMDIRAARGVKDDLAVVVGLSVLELSESGFEGLSTISLGTAGRPWEGRLADIRRGDDLLYCPMCTRFPKCWNDGQCECCGT